MQIRCSCWIKVFDFFTKKKRLRNIESIRTKTNRNEFLQRNDTNIIAITSDELITKKAVFTSYRDHTKSVTTKAFSESKELERNGFSEV